MNRLLPCCVLVPCLAAARLPAQTLSQTDLILGQPVAFTVAGTTLPAVAVFLLSPVGLGQGLCFPAPVSLCLDLLEPTSILAVTVADAQGNATLGFVLPLSLPLVPVFTQALVIGLSQPQPTFTKTNAVAASLHPLDVLSDTFDGNQLAARWHVHNPQMLALSVAGGELHLTPTMAGPQATWYQDFEGPMLWQEITGDFTVTASVRAEDPTQPGQPPPVSYRLGGLTVRDPASAPGHRNYCHVALGAGTGAVPVAAEDKTTLQSQSNFVLYPIAGARGELRITRQGAQVSLWFRAPGAPAWQLLRAHNRPDLPATVQVGPMVYSNQSPPSITIHFDDVRFAR